MEFNRVEVSQGPVQETVIQSSREQDQEWTVDALDQVLNIPARLDVLATAMHYVVEIGLFVAIEMLYEYINQLRGLETS